MESGTVTDNGFPFISVIGATNIDISARPKEHFILRDSNPGKVSFSFGGVGRNIAHNLCLLGLPVRFITVFGGDAYAEELREDCGKIGMNLDACQIIPTENSSVYLCIHDETGDMVAAVCDMGLTRRLSSDFLAERKNVINASKAVVFDTNLEPETIQTLLSFCEVPLFADTVSCKKAERLLPFLSEKRSRGIFALKANRAEAEVLLGHPITGEKGYRKAVTELQSRNIDRVYITLGEEGVIAFDGKTIVRLPCEKATVVNATGAGDAFLSAVVYAYAVGASFEASAAMGQKAAGAALESVGPVCPSLSPEILQI